MIWYFIGVYIINRTLQNFSFRLEKYFTRVSAYFLTLNEKFRISSWPGNILYKFIRLFHTVSFALSVDLNFRGFRRPVTAPGPRFQNLPISLKKKNTMKH